MDLSVVVPVWTDSQREELPRLLRSVREALHDVAPDAEIVVAVGRRAARLRETVEDLDAAFVEAGGSGFGEIVRAGIERSSGRYIITVDAEAADPAAASIRSLWRHRHEGEVVLASRYIRGARVQMTRTRLVMSRALNVVYRRVLSVPYRDISNGFRLFHRKVLDDIAPLRGRGLDILPESVVRAYCQGWRVQEVPADYEGAGAWRRARLLKLGSGFLPTVTKLFGLRNSVRAADYDHRAYNSWIPLQRYWQRQRFRIIHEFANDTGLILDIGCGSSRIYQTLPRAVGLDLAVRKLRWLRGPGRHLVQADMSRLPFGDGAFGAVVCSEVIEHIPREQVRIGEMVRVIAPGGLLILGTPDYGRRLWLFLEWVYGKVFPGGYASEHINRYTYDGLRAELEGLGLDVLDCRYVARSEMIFKARAPAARPATASATRG